MLASLAAGVASDFSQRIDEHYATATAAWPTIQLSRERFREHVEARLRGAHDMLQSADVYLAAACADGDPVALSLFRDTHLPPLRAALGKLAMTPAQIDETVQRVLVLVFVGDGGAPQIETYSGRGTLRSWLRTIAVRTGRRMLGQDSAPTDDDEVAALPAAVDDPHLALLRDRHRDQVREAFALAFAGLAERERNVLRQYHLDGLTIDQLAALYQVNRATTARWVAGARLAVVTRTRALLVEKFSISATDVDSIIRLVRSQLDVSVRSVAG